MKNIKNDILKNINSYAHYRNEISRISALLAEELFNLFNEGKLTNSVLKKYFSIIKDDYIKSFVTISIRDSLNDILNISIDKKSVVEILNSGKIDEIIEIYIKLISLKRNNIIDIDKEDNHSKFLLQLIREVNKNIINLVKQKNNQTISTCYILNEIIDNITNENVVYDRTISKLYKNTNYIIPKEQELLDNLKTSIIKYNESLTQNKQVSFNKKEETFLKKQTREERILMYEKSKLDKQNKYYMDAQYELTSEQLFQINSYIEIIKTIKEDEIKSIIDILPRIYFDDEKVMLKEIISRLKKINNNHIINKVLIILNDKLKELSYSKKKL